MSSTIPLEIEELIISLVSKDDKNYLAVKRCSLVCRTFLHICRKHIFASIVLRSSRSHNIRQIERLLSKSPEIADYIRKLDYTIATSDITSPSIQTCLKQIPKLHSLLLRNHNDLDWSSNDLRPALLHLLHLPTLTDFQIIGFNNFIVSDLIPCVNLKKLCIVEIATVLLTNTSPATLPDRSIRLNELDLRFRNAKAIMDMLAQRPDRQPVIDFSSLARISLLIEKDSDIEAVQELFSRCKQLIGVCIYWEPRQACPSISKFLRSSMQTLRQLDLTTFVYGCDLDPLIGIPSELEDMRTKNIIESIVIVVADHECRRGDDWDKLDEVLTRSGWPALRQVSLTLYINTRGDDELGVTLQKLPETRFRQLSTSKSISFKFNVTESLCEVSL